MKLRNRRNRGQTIVEYVLIIAIVVVAAVGILSVFSDTVRGKIAGIIRVFDPSADTSSADTSSLQIMQDLGPNSSTTP
jgi:Flp pilus assembly pilin Flp